MVDITEYQTIDELVRATYRMTKEVHSELYGNGKPGVCKRLNTVETALKVVVGTISLAIPVIIVLIKKG